LIVIAAGFANVALEPHGVVVGLAVAVGEGVGVGGTVAVGVGDGVGGTVAVGDGVAQAPPAIKETSSMTKLPVPLLGPIYSKSSAWDAPLAKAFRLTIRSV
jgi:UDP-3-O-[3-hydroxymyristoyl] glucosamine N-acyltransferase